MHIVMDGWHVQIDAGPEFRIQCLRHDLRQIDTFILTHGHADHLMGMDDLRRFCDLRNFSAIEVFGSEEGLGRVSQVFPYAIGEKPVRKGYAAFRPVMMPEKLEVPGGTIYSTPAPARHLRDARAGLRGEIQRQQIRLLQRLQRDHRARL